MTRRSWYKVYAEKWLRGTLRQETAELRGVWNDVLAMAADSSHDGVLEVRPGMGFADEHIARVLNITIDCWLQNKQRLLDTDRLRKSGDNVLEIVNWGRYQSEYARLKPYKSRRYRKGTTKGTTKGTSKGITVDLDLDLERTKNLCTSGKPNVHDRFDELWQSYPRKVDRSRAEKAFRAHVKTDQDFEDCRVALEKYCGVVQGKEPQYIKHGATFFNSWRDWLHYEPEAREEGAGTDHLPGSVLAQREQDERKRKEREATSK